MQSINDFAALDLLEESFDQIEAMDTEEIFSDGIEDDEPLEILDPDTISLDRIHLPKDDGWTEQYISIETASDHYFDLDESVLRSRIRDGKYAIRRKIVDKVLHLHLRDCLDALAEEEARQNRLDETYYKLCSMLALGYSSTWIANALSQAESSNPAVAPDDRQWADERVSRNRVKYWMRNSFVSENFADEVDALWSARFEGMDWEDLSLIYFEKGRIEETGEEGAAAAAAAGMETAEEAIAAAADMEVARTPTGEAKPRHTLVERGYRYIAAFKTRFMHRYGAVGNKLAASSRSAPCHMSLPARFGRDSGPPGKPPKKRLKIGLFVAGTLLGGNAMAFNAYEFGSVEASGTLSALISQQGGKISADLSKIKKAMRNADANASAMVRNMAAYFELSARNSDMLKEILKSEEKSHDAIGTQIDAETEGSSP